MGRPMLLDRAFLMSPAGRRDPLRSHAPRARPTPERSPGQYPEQRPLPAPLFLRAFLIMYSFVVDLYSEPNLGNKVSALPEKTCSFSSAESSGLVFIFSFPFTARSFRK